MKESFKNFETAVGKIFKKKERPPIPLDVVERKVSYLKELDLTHPQLQWLANVFYDIDVARTRNRKIDEEVKEYSRSQGIEPLKARIKVDLEELMQVYLMQQRDIKRHGPDFIGPDTEEKLEIIITDLWGAIDPIYGDEAQKNLKGDIEYRESEGENMEYAHAFNRWWNDVKGLQEKTPKEKAALLSKFITILHGGGRNLGVGYFNPHPSEFYDTTDPKNIYQGAANENERKFLEALNNLGNNSYWEQHPEALSKMVILEEKK